MRKTVIFFAVGALMFKFSAKVNAQTPNLSVVGAEQEKLWKILETPHVHRFQAHWEVTTQQTPNPGFDTKAAMVRLKSLRPLGPEEEKAYPDLIEKVKENRAKALSDSRSGYLYHDDLDIVRIDNRVKGEVKGIESFRAGRAIDYFDGINSVSLNEITFFPPKSSPIKSLSGIVSRKADEVLRLTAAGDTSIIYALADVTNKFNRHNSEMRISNDALILRRNVAWQERFPKSYSELVLDKKDLSIQSIRYYLDDNKPFSSIDVKDYINQNGVKIPSEVVNCFLGRNKPGTVSETHTLQWCKIGDEVDEASLILPANVHLTDYRFGEDKSVPYKLKGGVLPSDSEVLKLLGEKQKLMEKHEEKFKRASATGRQGVNALWGSLLGAAFLCMAGGMLINKKK